MSDNQNGDVSGTEMVSGRYTLLWQSRICAGEEMKKAKQAFEESIATDNFRYVCQADSVKYLELCDKYSND